jgi:hypothetical protein
MPDLEMADSPEPDAGGAGESRAGRASHEAPSGSRPQTDAERYFEERLRDPEYAAAYRAGRRRLRRLLASSHREIQGLAWLMSSDA